MYNACTTHIYHNISSVHAAGVTSRPAVHCRVDLGGFQIVANLGTCTDSSDAQRVQLTCLDHCPSAVCMLQVWHHALQSTVDLILEGLARAGAKVCCTTMGRVALIAVHQ